MALARPDRIEALIVQNAVADNEGLEANWKTRRAFWADRAANESALRTNLRWRRRGRAMSGAIRTWNAMTRICGPMSLPFSINPARSKFKATSSTTRTNVDSYPKSQAWMREKQPRLLVIWRKYDPSFDISEPEAYHRDVPKAQVHVLDARIDPRLHRFFALRVQARHVG
jgi:pimeloyl-ACP methyl ester carboxylesterase